MRIASVQTLGVSGLVDRHDAFARGDDAPARVVALVGPRGRGKTRLLEAMATAKECAAPYGAVPSSSDWVREDRPAKVCVTWWLDEHEREFAGVRAPLHATETSFARDKIPWTSGDPGLRAVLGRYEHGTSHGKVDYLPADRRIPRFAARTSSLELDQKQRRLTRDEGKYGAIPHFVADLLRNDPERARAVGELFTCLSGGRRLVGVDGVGALRFASPTEGSVPLDRLPRGDETAFLIAASMFMLGLERSVVLFDVPELHLAPGEAARMLAELVARSPSTQWIVASHDPEVARMADVVIDLGEAA